MALLAAGMLVGMLSVTPAGAHVTNGVAHVAKHMKKTFYTKAEIDQRVQWAAVAADGTLERSRGVSSSAKPFDDIDGLYFVRFPSSVLDCAYTATVGSTDTDGDVGVVVAPGTAWVRSHDGYVTNIVEVFTYDGDGTPTDMDLFLQVTC